MRVPRELRHKDSTENLQGEKHTEREKPSKFVFLMTCAKPDLKIRRLKTIDYVSHAWFTGRSRVGSGWGEVRGKTGQEGARTCSIYLARKHGVPYAGLFWWRRVGRGPPPLSPPSPPCLHPCLEKQPSPQSHFYREMSPISWSISPSAFPPSAGMGTSSEALGVIRIDDSTSISPPEQGQPRFRRSLRICCPVSVLLSEGGMVWLEAQIIAPCNRNTKIKDLSSVQTNTVRIILLLNLIWRAQQKEKEIGLCGAAGKVWHRWFSYLCPCAPTSK